MQNLKFVAQTSRANFSIPFIPFNIKLHDTKTLIMTSK